jgi:hypothetical protein
MISPDYPSTSRLNRILGLMIATSSFIGNVDAAEEKKANTPAPVTYTKPSFGPFSSQMPDALLGNDKYEKPVWNLHDALKLPDWLSVSVEHRTRYETMANSFRASSKGGDQQIAFFTNLWLEARLGQFRFGTEFNDARELGSDSGSPITNSQVNTADFTQAYIAWSEQNLFHDGIGIEFIGGRQTMNLGSRRLVARSYFRNTNNNFTGGRLRLTDYSHWQLNTFVTMPVLRFPSSATNLLNDVHQFDQEDTHTLFSGAFLEVYNLAWNINSEFYLYHLDEGDSPRNLTRNRRYLTPGARFFIKPAKGEFDFQLESIGQIGSVRATTANTDGKKLEHLAWMQHFDAGYTFDMPWTPRLALEYDYVSGDKNPTDNKDQRFDTLYGPTVFEFGPTGIYNGFARANINTPGYRIRVAPRADVQATLAHRAYWLAQSKDSWGTSGLQDKTGRSGDFVGHQLEFNVRYDFNSSLNFETGWTHLFKGQFAKKAPLAPSPQDVDYFYIQTLLRF